MADLERNLINELKAIFPETSWSWAIPALRRDPLIWKQLFQDQFRKDLEQKLGQEPENWSPARIALTSLESQLSFELSWPLASFQALPPELSQMVYQLDLGTAEVLSSENPLSDAALVALALWGENSTGTSWRTILSDLPDLDQHPTTLAILVGLIDTPRNLLLSLSPELAVRIWSAIPISPNQRSRVLVEMLEDQRPGISAAWLRILELEMQDLAARTAKQLLEKFPNQPEDIQSALQLAELHQISGDTSSSLTCLKKASQLNNQLVKKLSADLNKVGALVSPPQESDPHWKELKQAVQDQDAVQQHAEEIAGVLHTLIDRGHLEAAGELLADLQSPLPDSPHLLTAMAAYALERDQKTNGGQLALLAVEKTDSKSLPPLQLPAVLLAFKLFSEAVQIANQILRFRPNHLPSLLAKGDALAAVGDPLGAAADFQLAALLQPEKLSHQRKAARNLEQASAWDEALDIRSSILAHLQENGQEKSPLQIHLPVEDLLSFAECANQSGKFNRAQTAARQVLQSHPEHGGAHTALGKSLLAQNQTEEAFRHFQKAVDFAPEEEETWIAKAQAEADSGEPQTAVKTLQMGIKAAATRSKALLVLGQLQYDNQSYSRALEYLQQAAERAQIEEVNQPVPAEINCLLGQTYYQLGHLDQARKTLRGLQRQYPGFQKGNQVYGQVLLDLSEPRAALPFLSKAIQNEPSDPEPYLYYADAQLQIGLNPTQAVEALQKAAELEPDHPRTSALLGEAEAASGNLTKALEFFQKALETPLRNDPQWGPRITLGLGKTALALDKIDTALATLKEGYEKDPQHLGLLKGLAEAYRTADLFSNARELIREAAQISPDDPELLKWIADFSLEINAPTEAVSALEKIIKTHPGRHENYLLLGRAQKAAGSTQKAVASYASLNTLDDVDPKILLQAGDNLIKLGEIETGMKSLRTAARICESNQEPSHLLAEIYSRLSAAFRLNGDYRKAEKVIDQAIEIELEQPELRIQKANLLLAQEKNQAALASLKNALDLCPEDPALHLKIAEVLKSIGLFEDALYHSMEAAAGYSENDQIQDDEYLLSAALSADLAAGLLKPDQAQEILANLKHPDQNAEKPLNPVLVHALCLKAELNLEQGQEIEAAELGNILVTRAGSHFRVKALQARILTAVQGNPDASREALQEAAADFHSQQYHKQIFPSAVENSLGSCARENLDWDQAVSHFQHAVQRSPGEPRSLVNLVETLIARAEAHRFAAALKLVHSAPDSDAVSPAAWTQTQQAVEKLKKLDLVPGLAAQFEKRGRAVFTPNLESAQAFQTSAADPDEKAALIAAYRNSRQLNLAAEIALEQMETLGQNPYLDAQVSLALQKVSPEKSAAAAASSLEAARQKAPHQIPMYKVLLAMAEKQTGNLTGAKKHLESALEVWPDEPRWHALLAKVSLHPDESAAALEKSIELEPEYAGHYLSYGQVKLSDQQPDQAVGAFQQAVQINSEYREAWLGLAESYLQLSELERARECSQKALEISPNHIPSQKTAARTAIQMGDFRTAENYLVAVLGQDKKDTEAMSLLAETLTAQRKPEEALLLLEQAIQLEDDALDLELQKAALIHRLDGAHAAVDTLRLLGSQYPNRYPLILALVNTLAEAGETDQAIRTAQEVLHNGELSHTSDQKAQLHLITGRLLRSAGQLDQAVHHLHQSKKISGTSYQAVLELGRVHYDRRQYDQALEQIQDAIQIAPERARGYYLAGKVLKELKQYDRAERMLRRAAKLAPHDLKIHRQLGVLVTLNLVHGEPKAEAVA